MVDRSGAGLLGHVLVDLVDGEDLEAEEVGDVDFLSGHCGLLYKQ